MSEILAAPYVNLPPTQAEPPYDDGMSMESQRHKMQMDVLIDALSLWLELTIEQVANITGLPESQINNN